MDISVLGCGWLGFPLAKRLIEEGHIVKGSTTRREKMKMLTDEGITPYQIKLFEEGVQGDLSAFLDGSELLIINIPPGLRKDPTENYIAKIGRLNDYSEKAHVKQVIFVSSTSVYEDTKEFPVYTEEDEPNGTAKNSVQLQGAEKVIKNSANFSSTIIRFGGLIGTERHPVKFLSGKKDIKNPEAPVNLIALQDCIGIILKVIENKAWGETFNAVFPEHPSKIEYYQKLASDKKLPLPDFDKTTDSKGKIIDSVKVEELRYTFQQGIY